MFDLWLLCLPISLVFSWFCCHFCCTHRCLSDESSVCVDRPCVGIHRPRSAHYTTYAAFKWLDMNFEDGSLQVKRAVSYLKGYGYIESEPKTAKGRRMIKLPVFVVAILRRHKAQQEEHRREVGSAWIEKDLMFTNAQGYFYSASTLRKV